MKSVSFKQQVLAAVVQNLNAEIERLAAAAKESYEGATHEENRAEHSKDMRATESSYIAAGQSARLFEACAARDRVVAFSARRFGESDAVAPGALVTLRDDRDVRTVLLILNDAGGVRVEVEERTVQVVSPSAPLGRALLGAKVGTFVEIPGRGATREREIEQIE